MSLSNTVSVGLCLTTVDRKSAQKDLSSGSCNEKGLHEIGGITGFIDTGIQRWTSWPKAILPLLCHPQGWFHPNADLPSLYRMTTKSNTNHVLPLLHMVKGRRAHFPEI